MKKIFFFGLLLSFISPLFGATGDIKGLTRGTSSTTNTPVTISSPGLNTVLKFKGSSTNPVAEAVAWSELTGIPTPLTGIAAATGTDGVLQRVSGVYSYVAGASGITNLSYTASPTNGVVVSDTGTDATLPLADSTNSGLFSPTEKTKLAAIAAGATVNSTDATLLARANHTGTQAANTITGLAASATTDTTSATNITTGTLALARMDPLAATDAEVAAAIAAAAPVVNNIVTDATTARTLILTDATKYIRFTNVGAITLTIPLNASVAFPIGTEIYVRRASGAGVITLGGGATVEGASTAPTVSAGGNFALKKTGTDTWDLL